MLCAANVVCSGFFRALHPNSQLLAKMVSPHAMRNHHEGASASSSMSQFGLDLRDLREHQSLGAYDIPSTSTSTCKKLLQVLEDKLYHEGDLSMQRRTRLMLTLLQPMR